MSNKESPYKRKSEYKNIIQFDKNGFPTCEKHGAMLCVNKKRTLWRCIQCGVGVSFNNILVFDTWLRLWSDRTKLGIPTLSSAEVEHEVEQRTVIAHILLKGDT